MGYVGGRATFLTGPATLDRGGEAGRSLGDAQADREEAERRRPEGHPPRVPCRLSPLMAVNHPAGPVQLAREIQAAVFGPLNRAGDLAGGPEQRPELGGLALGPVRRAGENGRWSPGLLDPLRLRMARGCGVVPRARRVCPPAVCGRLFAPVNRSLVAPPCPGRCGRFSAPVFRVLRRYGQRGTARAVLKLGGCRLDGDRSYRQQDGDGEGTVCRLVHR